MSNYSSYYSNPRRDTLRFVTRFVALWCFIAIAAYSLRQLAGGPPPDALDITGWAGHWLSGLDRILAGDPEAVPSGETIRTLATDPSALANFSAALSAFAWLWLFWLGVGALVRYAGWAVIMVLNYLLSPDDSARAADSTDGIVHFLQPPMTSPAIGFVVAILLVGTIGLSFREAQFTLDAGDPATSVATTAETTPTPTPTPAQSFVADESTGSDADEPASLPPEEWREYVVQPGDWLTKIALREIGSSAIFTEIRSADGAPLSDIRIHPGQVLLLPMHLAPGARHVPVEPARDAADGPAADGPAADGPAADGPAVVDGPAVDGPAVVVGPAVDGPAIQALAAGAQAAAEAAHTADNTRFDGWVRAQSSDLDQAARTLALSIERRARPIVVGNLNMHADALADLAVVATRLVESQALFNDATVAVGDVMSQARSLEGAGTLGLRLYDDNLITVGSVGAQAIRMGTVQRLAAGMAHDQPAPSLPRTAAFMVGAIDAQMRGLRTAERFAEELLKREPAASAVPANPETTDIVVHPLLDQTNGAAAAAALGTQAATGADIMLLPPARQADGAAAAAARGTQAATGADIMLLPPARQADGAAAAAALGTTLAPATVDVRLMPFLTQVSGAAAASSVAPPDMPDSRDEPAPTPDAISTSLASHVRDARDTAGGALMMVVGVVAGIPPVVAGAGVVAVGGGYLVKRNFSRINVLTRRRVTTFSRQRQFSRHSGTAPDAARIVRVIDMLLRSQRFNARVAFVQSQAHGYSLHLVCDDGEADRIVSASGRLAHILDAPISVRRSRSDLPVELHVSPPPDELPEILRDGGSAVLIPAGADADGRAAFINLLGVGAIELAGPQLGRQALLRDYVAVIRETSTQDYSLWADANTTGMVPGQDSDVAALLDASDRTGCLIMTPGDNPQMLALARRAADDSLGRIQLIVTVPEPQIAWGDARVRWEPPGAGIAQASRHSVDDTIFQDDDEESVSTHGSTVVIRLAEADIRLSRLPVNIAAGALRRPFDEGPAARVWAPRITDMSDPRIARMPVSTEVGAITVGSLPDDADDASPEGAATSAALPDADDPLIADYPVDEVEADGAAVDEVAADSAAVDEVEADGAAVDEVEADGADESVEAGTESSEVLANGGPEIPDGEHALLLALAEAEREEAKVRVAEQAALAGKEQDARLAKRAAAVRQARNRRADGADDQITSIADQMALLSGQGREDGADDIGMDVFGNTWGDTLFRISLLGPFMLRYRRADGSYDEVRTTGTQIPDLLSILAAHDAAGGEGMPRAQLAEHIWPDATPSARSQRLRTMVHRTKSTIENLTGGRSLVEADTQALHFASGVATSDLAVLISLHQSARREYGRGNEAAALSIWSQAVALVRGEVLTGTSAEWANDVRDGVHQIAQEIAADAIPVAEDAGFSSTSFSAALDRLGIEALTPGTN